MITSSRSILFPAAMLAGLLGTTPASAGMLESKCHPLGLLGGYRQHDLGDRTFQISVLGNGMAGREFPKACTLERAQAIAVEHGFSRFAVVQYKGSITYRRASGSYVSGSAKTVIKLLGPGEAASAIKDNEVIYFDVNTMQPEIPRDTVAYVSPVAAGVAGSARVAAPRTESPPVDVLGLLSDPARF